MLIGGLVLIAVAAGALAYAHFARRAARGMTATETLSCGDITTLAQGVAGEVGGGSFRQRCEVVGAAAPGPGGAIRAPESGQEAVWHRTQVTRHWRERQTVQRDGRSVTEMVDRSETVSEIVSEAPFVVRDDSGTIAVAPAGADVDAPEKVVDRSEQGDRADSAVEVVAGALLGSEQGERFEHEEWIIRPGARLYVHGEISDATGQVAFAKPADGRFLISTRSEEQIVKGKETAAKVATWVGAAAAVAGVVLVVAGAAG